MKYDKYISLIKSLEKTAVKDRRSYNFKVLLLTILGYAYFIGLILLMLVPMGLAAGVFLLAPAQIGRILLLSAKLWWALIPAAGVYFGFIGSAVKSITTKVPDPEGTELSRSDAPELFDFIEEACSYLKAKTPQKVLIVDAFNASVATMPKYGIFGRKVMLMIGLPLMKALSPEQFKAVLAHEIGHISGKHGAFAKWAYQMREAWGRLIDSQEATNHKFAALYKNFVNWFFPYFTAYSFVLMREHEKDADKEAAQIIGGTELGEALIVMETRGRSLEEDFWLKIHEENITSESPSADIFSRMLGHLAVVDNERAISALSKAVTVPTDFDDTHPALADRLKLIGYWDGTALPKLPMPVGADAADVFLGATAKKFETQFDAEWTSKAGQQWKEKFEYFQKTQKRINELEESRANGPLPLEELRELTRLRTEKEGYDSVIPLIEEAAERFPEEGVVWFNLGLARLSQEDESGLSHLQKAASLDVSFKFEADQYAFNFLRGKGRLDEARQYANSIDEQSEVFEKAQKERGAPLPGDTFEAHRLSKELVDSIPQKIAGLDEVIAIYGVNKVVKYFPEQPYRVMFIHLRKKGRIKNRHDADASAILNIIVERFDTGEIHYFAILAGEWAGTKYYLDRIPGALIYSKPTQ